MDLLPALSAFTVFIAIAAVGFLFLMVSLFFGEIDQGNGTADGGSSGLSRLAKTSPAVVFSLLQQLEALGLNLPTVMQQLGIQSSAPAVPAEARRPPESPKAKPA